MSIIGWLVLGLIAGFIASKIYAGSGQGIVMDIVLGVVGAGGLGRDLRLALSWFDYGRASTLILALLAMVFLADLASGALRARLVLRAGAPIGAEARRD